MPSPPLAQPSSWPRPRASIATVRKRADKACQPCRARKVRCNISDNGEPCNNCCMRGVTCVPSGNRPSRKKPQGATKSLSWINKHPQVSSDAKESERKRPNITDTSFRLWTEIDEGSDELGDGHEIQDVDSSGTISNLVKTVSMHGDRTATRLDESTGDSGKYLTTPPLPPYIKSPPKSMTTEDTKFLWAKGALSIPYTTFRNELIRCYIEFVHPELPLIDLHDFLRLIDGSGDQGSISLVLFQAILFAGAAFVDQSALQEAGYSTRREVRTAFYHRARLLYDFDYEDDRIALLQSLLLMSLYCENPDNQKDGWHWIGVAISFAHTLGIHRNLEASVADGKKLRLYRRLWWCCIMRDRLLSLGMRRPARIDDEDFNLPMLTVEDFEIKSLVGDDINIALDQVIIGDTSVQTHMAMIFIAKARLCLCINHVLAAQYSAHVEDHGVEARLMLIPKRSSQSQISSCDFELTDWFRSLPPSCRYTTPTTQDFSAPVVQRAILHMLYFSTISTLHRPRALPTGPSSHPADLQEISRWKIRDASNEITKIMLDLHRLNLTRYLPTTGVTVLLPAIVIHLLDSTSSDMEAHEAGRNGLAQCMDVLQQLRDKYAPADDAIQFLEGALRRSNIDLRILNVMGKITVQGLDSSSLQSQQTVHNNLELQYPQINHNTSESASSLHDMAWGAFEDDNDDYDLQSTATSPENRSQSYDLAPDIDQSLSNDAFSPLVGIDNTDFDYVFQALVNFNGEANIMGAE